MIDALTLEDKERLQAVVAEAEQGTSGEIVVCLVHQSDTYPAAVLRLAIVFGAVFMASVLIVARIRSGWGWVWFDSPEGLALCVLVGGLLGALLGRAPALRRVFAGKDKLRAAVQQRAYQSFVDEEVFETRGRTGILIFVSEFERRIEILADTGINGFVDGATWQRIADTFAQRAGSGEMLAGLENVIKECGALLRDHGVGAGVAPADELSDELRIASRDGGESG